MNERDRIEDEIVSLAKEASGEDSRSSWPSINARYAGSIQVWYGSIAVKPSGKRNRFAYGRGHLWSAMLVDLLRDVKEKT